MGQIGDMVASTGISLPKVSFEGLGKVGMIILFIFVGGGLILLFVYWLTKRLMFNKRVVIWRRINGRMIKVDEDKGAFQKIGKAGDTWFFWRKYKKYTSRPQIEQEKNTYWYFIREDGEAINFGLGDVDEQMKTAKAHYIDSDMSLSRVAIERNLKDRYQVKSFWDKYGDKIMFIIYALILMICTIINTSKQLKAAELFTSVASKLAGYCSGVVTS